MITKIDATCYVDLIHSGIKNLERYRGVLNDLNVFPVPDGDTGTNMVMTLRSGYESIKDFDSTLSETSRRFSSSAVFGARGNSGVIVSQFFKGISVVLDDLDFIDCYSLAEALESGCKYAYASVSQPVEGTILTVLKDATIAVKNSLPLVSINEAVDIFLMEAKISLANTPELLPVLKKANVVDSGASGIVYFFEGVKLYLNGESIEDVEVVCDVESIDLSSFNKNSLFLYGYCVEVLLQLNNNTFDHNTFKRGLFELGDSIVSSLEGDKVKLHIHVKKLAPVMEYCQKFGEFLTIKIENMSVQNLQKDAAQNEIKKFLYDPDRESTNYAVVAVATNPYMQKQFFDMGADVVILSEIAPSSKDFLDAFKLVPEKQILVFPNSANSILAAMQAGSLSKGIKVTVLNCRSDSECYSILSMIDFNSTVDEAVVLANNTISSIYQFSIYRAPKDVKFGSKKIYKNDYFALSGKKILSVKNTLEAVLINTIYETLNNKEYDIVTLFYGKSVSDETMSQFIEKLDSLGFETEFASVKTYESAYDVTVTFE